jgi:hypothetical protein
VGIRCADHVTPSTRKSRQYFGDSGGRSVGIIRLRTKATGFYIYIYIFTSIPYRRYQLYHSSSLYASKTFGVL